MLLLFINSNIFLFIEDLYNKAILPDVMTASFRFRANWFNSEHTIIRVSLQKDNQAIAFYWKSSSRMINSMYKCRISIACKQRFFKGWFVWNGFDALNCFWLSISYNCHKNGKYHWSFSKFYQIQRLLQKNVERYLFISTGNPATFAQTNLFYFVPLFNLRIVCATFSNKKSLRTRQTHFTPLYSFGFFEDVFLTPSGCSVQACRKAKIWVEPPFSINKAHSNSVPPLRRYHLEFLKALG